MEIKFDGNYIRMLRAILNESWRQQLYGYLPPIMKTIQVRRTRHAGHYWRSRNKLMSDILLWTPSNGWAKTGQPTRTYIQQLCADTGCSLEDLQGAMDNRDRWQKSVREIRAGSTWWWWSELYIYIYIVCVCYSIWIFKLVFIKYDLIILTIIIFVVNSKQQQVIIQFFRRRKNDVILVWNGTL